MLEDGSEDEADFNMEDWCAGKLKFRGKHIDDAYRLGGDGRRMDDYDVIDTRDPMSLLTKIKN